VKNNFSIPGDVKHYFNVLHLDPSHCIIFLLLFNGAPAHIGPRPPLYEVP
jgi:hypothetical protein